VLRRGSYYYDQSLRCPGLETCRESTNQNEGFRGAGQENASRIPRGFSGNFRSIDLKSALRPPKVTKKIRGVGGGGKCRFMITEQKSSLLPKYRRFPPT